MRLRLPRPVTLQAIAIALTGLSSIAWLPGVGAPYARFAATLLAAAAWLLVWAAGALERLTPDRHLFIAGLSLGAVAVVVSSMNSRFPATSLTYGGATSVSAPYWISLLLILGLSARVTLSSTTLRAIRWQFAWGVPVALVGIFQALAYGHVVFGYRNVDYFAPMMLLFLPIALGFARVDGSRRLWWYVCAGVFTAAVLSSRTVSGLVGLGAEALFLAMFAPGLLSLSGRTRRTVIVLFGGAGLAFALFGAAYLADVLPAPVDSFANTTLFGASAATRAEMWRVAGQELKSHLITGVGPDQYSFEGQRYFSRRMFRYEFQPQPDIELPVDPHSALLLVPVDFGLLGVAAALLVAAGWARGVMRPRFRSTEGALLRWSFALGALGLGYTILFTPFPLLFGGFPLLVAGLAKVRPADPRPQPVGVGYSAPKWVLALAVTCAAVGLSWVAVSGWETFNDNAVVTDPNSGPARAARMQPRVAYFQYAKLWQQGRLLARTGRAEGHLRFQQAVDAAPLEVRGYAPYLVELVRLSLVDAIRRGRTDVSWETARLNDAERISPELPVIMIERAHAAIASGDLTEARRLLDESERWSASIPDHARYRELLRRFEAQR